MIRNLILLGLAFLLYRTVKSWLARNSSGSIGHEPEEDDVMVQDPVCGVYVPKKGAVTSRKGGETLYFCSHRCKETYDKTH